MALHRKAESGLAQFFTNPANYLFTSGTANELVTRSRAQEVTERAVQHIPANRRFTTKENGTR